MSPHAFAYRSGGVPFRFYTRGLPKFGHGSSDRRYRVIEDDDVAEELLEQENRHGKSYFRHIAPDRLDETLGESAEAAIDAIEAGEFDDVLDLLLFAEREVYDGRVTVIDAIRTRNRELIEERSEGDGTESTIQPSDLVSAE